MDIKLIARYAMENPFVLGFLSFILVYVPIMGIHLIHKYKWEHWEPFTRKHK